MTIPTLAEGRYVHPHLKPITVSRVLGCMGSVTLLEVVDEDGTVRHITPTDLIGYSRVEPDPWKMQRAYATKAGFTWRDEEL